MKNKRLIALFILASAMVISPAMGFRLPVPGSDTDIWGDVLNGFLNSSLGINGTNITANDGTFQFLRVGSLLKLDKVNIEDPNLFNFSIYNTTFGNSLKYPTLGLFGYEINDNQFGFQGGFYTPSRNYPNWEIAYNSKNQSVTICNQEATFDGKCGLQIFGFAGIQLMGIQTASTEGLFNVPEWNITVNSGNDLIIKSAKNTGGTAASRSKTISLIPGLPPYNNVILTGVNGFANLTVNGNVTVIQNITVPTLKVGQALCMKSNNQIGVCSSVVGITGGCTCV